MLRTVSLSAPATVLTLSASVFAQPAPSPDPGATAAALFAEAEQARQAKDFHTCIDKAERAFATFPQAQIRGLQGLCENELERFVEAATHLGFYLDNTTAAPPEEIKSAFARAQARTVKLTITSDPAGAAIAIDGKASGACPLTVYVSPGTRVIAASKEGLPAKEDKRDLVAGTQINIKFELKKEGVGPIEPRPSKMPMWPAVLGYTVAGVGLALGAGMTVASVVRNGDADDFSRDCTAARYASCAKAGQDISDQSDTFGTIGIIGFGVAGAALAFSIPWSIAAASSDDGSDDVSFTPSFSNDFVGGSLRGSF